MPSVDIGMLAVGPDTLLLYSPDAFIRYGLKGTSLSEFHGGEYGTIPFLAGLGHSLPLALQCIASHHLDRDIGMAMPCSAAAHLQYALLEELGSILSLSQIKRHPLSQ
jgi:hypothetical protein